VTPPELALIVPRYNEAARLDPAAFLAFAAAHPRVRLQFVGDGSTDGTGRILEHGAGGAWVRDDRAASLARRQGGGRAHRDCRFSAVETSFVGFYDADVATPLSAVDDFLAVLRRYPGVDIVLGSRVMLMGRNIKRKASRHLSAASLRQGVSHALDLAVYDTQCGAKVLRVPSPTSIFAAQPVDLRRRAARALSVPAGRAGEPARRDRIYELVLPQWEDRPDRSCAGRTSRAAMDLGYIWRECVAHQPREGTATAGPAHHPTTQPPGKDGLAQESTR